MPDIVNKRLSGDSAEVYHSNCVLVIGEKSQFHQQYCFWVIVGEIGLVTTSGYANLLATNEIAPEILELAKREYGENCEFVFVVPSDS